MPQSYKNDNETTAEFRVAYTAYNPKAFYELEYKKPSIWGVITGSVYRLVSFWLPISIAIVIYCGAIFGLIWAVEYASR